MNTTSRMHLALLVGLGACATPPPCAVLELPGALAPAFAPARSQHGGSLAPVAGDRRLAVGVGTTDGPDTFLLSGDADFYQSDRVAIGPSLQLGFADRTAIIAPTFHGKFLFPTERSADGPHFLPFVQGGAGLAYIQKDRVGKDDELGLALQAGGGLEVRFDDTYALTSTLLVNVMPAKVLDERAYLSWQIVQFSFRF